MSVDEKAVLREMFERFADESCDPGTCNLAEVYYFLVNVGTVPLTLEDFYRLSLGLVRDGKLQIEGKCLSIPSSVSIITFRFYSEDGVISNWPKTYTA